MHMNFIVIWMEVPECINHSRGVRSIRWAEHRNVLLQLYVHLWFIWYYFSGVMVHSLSDHHHISSSSFTLF